MAGSSCTAAAAAAAAPASARSRPTPLAPTRTRRRACKLGSSQPSDPNLKPVTPPDVNHRRGWGGGTAIGHRGSVAERTHERIMHFYFNHLHKLPKKNWQSFSSSTRTQIHESTHNTHTHFHSNTLPLLPLLTVGTLDEYQKDTISWMDGGIFGRYGTS